jgi:TonB-dependent receptor
MTYRSPMSLLALAVISTIATSATAQSSTAAPAAGATAKAKSDAEQIVVVGQRAAIRRALQAQENANNIISVISSDDIGALPDKNAAEALARMPGVSVQRDQGEGRYVTIRGLGPDLNSVTINGALIPAPELGRRGVALDVLPAGIVRSLEVSKTLTPDMDANSIGGTIEIKTLSAFDLKGSLLSATVGGSYDSLANKTSPGGNFVWADKFMNGMLGVAIGGSAEKREFASDNVESGGAAWNAGRLSGFELRDYLPTRTRKSASLNLDFRPTASSKYYLQSFYSDFSDDELRDRLTLSNVTGGSVGEGVATTGRLERRLRDRKYTQEITSVQAGTDQQFGDWKLHFSGARSQAGEDTPEQLNDGRFRGNANFVGVGFTDTMRPTLFAPATAYDPNNYSLNAIVFQQRTGKDTEQHLKSDITRAFSAFGTNTELKFGGKSSRREKTNDTNQWNYNSNNPLSPNFFGAGPTSMAGFVRPGELAFTLGRVGPALDPGLIRARAAGLPRDPARDLSASIINDWRMNEDINAAYAQWSGTFDRVWLLAGTRNERTKFEARGTRVSGSTTTPNTTSTSYSNWMPSVQTRIDIDPNTALRAAWTNSLVRASFAQLAPGVNLASATEASFGNPDLKPMRSENFDFGLERTFGEVGAISAYYFNKQIKDFTYQTNLAGTGPWAGFTTATGFANGEAARVSGVEVSYTRNLRELPAPFDGLMVGINATYVGSSAKLARFDRTANAVLSRSVTLPGQSDRIVNLMLGYEKDAVSTRLAVNSKSRYLLQTGADVLNSNQDVWVDSQTQLDLSFAYRFNKRMQVIVEGINLNKERYYTYQGITLYNAQYETYGATWNLKFKFDLN